MEDDYGSGYFDLGFEGEELDALSAAAGERTDFVSMRMILPNWLMTMRLAGGIDEVDAGNLSDLRVAFTLMTPLPPPDWRHYWLTTVPLPQPFSETERMRPTQIPKMGIHQK